MEHLVSVFLCMAIFLFIWCVIQFTNEYKAKKARDREIINFYKQLNKEKLK